MEISPEIYTIILIGIGGAIGGALAYPLVTKYELWPSPPKEQREKSRNSLENLAKDIR